LSTKIEGMNARNEKKVPHLVAAFHHHTGNGGSHHRGA